MFSQLRQGTPIYILEKGDKPTLMVGQVVSEGKQVPKFPAAQPYQLGAPAEMVIDVVEVKVGEQTYKFEKLTPTLSIQDYGGAVVSDSREAMLQEVETMRTRSQQVLDSVDYHTAVIAAAEGMLEELNPRYKEEKKRDEEMRDIRSRLDGYDDRFDSLNETLGDIRKLLSKAAKG